MTRRACRHCYEEISQTGAGTWTDRNGFAVCVKAPLETVGTGSAAAFVTHEPMPELGRQAS